MAETSVHESVPSSSSYSYKLIYEDKHSEATVNNDSNEPRKIFFKAGSAGGSTDLIDLVKLYQDSGDDETLQQWVDICTKQREQLQNSNNKAIRSSNSENSIVSTNSGFALSLNSKEDCDYKKPFQSLDRLMPVKGDREAILEKCHSLDYRTQTQAVEPAIGLKRCQEMSNISIDDS
uniref:DUF3950 domain-containing protein n=1 Tax=Syphacia muris TaxID=451379 RepID=A0A0N5AIQ8_9BILA